MNRAKRAIRDANRLLERRASLEEDVKFLGKLETPSPLHHGRRRRWKSKLEIPT